MSLNGKPPFYNLPNFELSLVRLLYVHCLLLSNLSLSRIS